MEIELSTNRLPGPGYIEPPASQGATRVATDMSSSLQDTGGLQQRLNDIPLVRPDKVAQAQVLVSHPHYPPDDFVDRIATLLAIHWLGS